LNPPPSLEYYLFDSVLVASSYRKTPQPTDLPMQKQVSDTSKGREGKRREGRRREGKAPRSKVVVFSTKRRSVMT